MDMTTLTDDEARGALFAALSERLASEPDADAKDRTPTLFALSRHGNLLTVFQADGERLLTGELKWRHTEDADAPWKFHVDRIGKNKLRLVTVGGGSVEGTPQEVTDNIAGTFVGMTSR